jgi:hypothetical protein
MPPAEELYRENLALKEEVSSMKARLAWLEKQVFGAKSEKLPMATPAGQTTLGWRRRRLGRGPPSR